MKPFPYNVRVNSQSGAPMGRPGQGQDDDTYKGKLTIRPVPLSQGYDNGGAYWGINSRHSFLFCAWSPDQEIVRFFRAPSKAAATEEMREAFPAAKIAA